MITGPFVVIAILPFLRGLLLGKGSRKREIEADRFAVAVIKDPELVVRALTKMHTINESPHRMRTTDEVLSTHPSLVHRVEAIRSASKAPDRVVL